MRNARTLRLVVAFGILAVLMLVSLSSCATEPQLARLTVFVSGYTQGYFKNCGCSTGQSGGEMRKITLLNTEIEQALEPRRTDGELPAEVLQLEIGNFLNASDEVQKINSSCVLETTIAQDYDSIGVGRDELAYPQAELYALLKGSRLKLTAANLSFIPPEEGESKAAELNALFSDYQLREYANGFTIGVIQVVDEFAAERLGPLVGVEINAAAEAARRVLKSHRSKAQFWVLCVCSADRGGTQAEEVAAIEGIDVVVGYMEENPLAAEDATQAAWPYFLKRPFRKSKDLVKAEFFFHQDGNPPVVDGVRLKISEGLEADQLASECYGRIKAELEELENQRWEELSKQDAIPPYYIGFNKCYACHIETWKQLETSNHTQAYESLMEKGMAGSAACLPCHVVGYGDRTGWNKVENPEYMQGVWCENCHGPGQYHEELMRSLMLDVEYELPLDLAEDGRGELGLRPVSEETCLGCHDEENSPRFDFESYWEQIAH